MSNVAYWLPLIWIGLLGTAVLLYVLLDGFDLGIGILFPAHPEEDERDQMMNSVAPFWDGNETWLILGGGGLFVAFPKAYGVIMSGLYLPVILMLLALVFRGVAFEFRWVAKPKHGLWDLAFSGGSIVAAFMQGVILGGLLQGLPSENGVYTGTTFSWLAPFPLFAGLATVAGYALLGALWLGMRTEGELRASAHHIARPLLIAVLAAVLIVSLWTPFALPGVFERWFSLPNLFYLSPVPLLTLLAAYLCWRGIEEQKDAQAFLSAVAIFALGFAGLAISTLPMLVPPSLDVWQAAAAPSSQLFMLVGTLLFLPLILAYTAFVYWTFRGRVRSGEGYH